MALRQSKVTARKKITPNLFCWRLPGPINRKRAAAEGVEKRRGTKLTATDFVRAFGLKPDHQQFVKDCECGLGNYTQADLTAGDRVKIGLFLSDRQQLQYRN